MTDHNLIEFFFNPKKAKAIVCIRRNQRRGLCVSDVSKKIDTTYAHTSKLVSAMHDKGLVKKKEKGRKKELHLTDKGEDYAAIISKILDMMQEHDDVELTQSQENVEAPDFLKDGGVIKS